MLVQSPNIEEYYSITRVVCKVCFNHCHLNLKNLETYAIIKMSYSWFFIKIVETIYFFIPKQVLKKSVGKIAVKITFLLFIQFVFTFTPLLYVIPYDTIGCVADEYQVSGEGGSPLGTLSSTATIQIAHYTSVQWVTRRTRLTAFCRAKGLVFLPTTFSPPTVLPSGPSEFRKSRSFTRQMERVHFTWPPARLVGSDI